MHATEREKLILTILSGKDFVSFRELEEALDGSPATIRRDLERLDGEGKIVRVRGGAKAKADLHGDQQVGAPRLRGTPFDVNITRSPNEKQRIGREAARLCDEGEGIMIDGGSTTFQMCSSLHGLNLQVLTNSLHIVHALSNQPGTRVLIPGGAVFPEQNIVLPMFGEDLTPAFHAPKLFLGCSAIGMSGLMQDDVVLVASQRRFIERAEQVILLADATKFEKSSGNVVCPLSRIDILITDDRLTDRQANMIEEKGVTLKIV
ncbi:MAG: DeoR family transcriptional regulator [Ponticaulis sp.]|nr:DeoR family transcriptional regulator [Ponticaulis sp.]